MGGPRLPAALGLPNRPSPISKAAPRSRNNRHRSEARLDRALSGPGGQAKMAMFTGAAPTSTSVDTLLVEVPITETFLGITRADAIIELHLVAEPDGRVEGRAAFTLGDAQLAVIANVSLGSSDDTSAMANAMATPLSALLVRLLMSFNGIAALMDHELPPHSQAVCLRNSSLVPVEIRCSASSFLSDRTTSHFV